MIGLGYVQLSIVLEISTMLYAGYWIGGFGLGESMDDRPPLLNAVTV